jgi:hypothetical protein
MLLHAELAGIKTPGVSESSKVTGRKDLLQEFACRETAIHDKTSAAACRGLERVGAQQLGEVGINVDARVPNAEELIDESTSDNEYGTDGPGTECAGGHIWVIIVFNHSTDFCVGRVLHASY